MLEKIENRKESKIKIIEKIMDIEKNRNCKIFENAK